MCEHSRRGQFPGRPESGERIDRFIVSSEEMMELETIELFHQPPNLLSRCHHAGVATGRLSHELVDDGLKVATDVEPLNPELDGDA
jgi:hypothetical protein